MDTAHPRPNWQMKKVIPKKSSLEQALDFLSVAFKAGEDQSMYCNMELGFAVAFNLIIAVGTPIKEDLCACPHVALFQTALSRCGETYSITQLSATKLLVRSGDFHAYVPCTDGSALTWAVPDARIGTLDDRFMEALEKVAGLVVTKADAVLLCSIQLNNGSVIATDQTVVMEAWHGLTFPDGLLIPKIAYTKLRKIKKPIVGFGFSSLSVTFYFDDGTWLLTRLFQDKWPAAVRNHLLDATGANTIEESFFIAAKKVYPFSDTGRVYVEENLVSSHPFEAKEVGSGLSLAFEGARFEPRIYPGEALQYVARYAKLWNANARPNGTSFFGDNVRGMIFHSHLKEERAVNGPTDDEDIPF